MKGAGAEVAGHQDLDFMFYSPSLKHTDHQKRWDHHMLPPVTTKGMSAEKSRLSLRDPPYGAGVGTGQCSGPTNTQ